MNTVELLEMIAGLTPSEVGELERLLEEIKKNKNFAPPSDDDFLAALGPCGK